MLVAKYVYQRSDGLCFYERRIPKDLKAHYPRIKGPSIRLSLKTKNPLEAARLAAQKAAEHDAYWKSLRSHGANKRALTTPEIRRGAKALLEKLEIEPGEGLKQWADDPLEPYLHRKYGEDYARARHEHTDPDSAVDELVSKLDREALRLVYEDPSKPRTLLLSEVAEHYLRYHRNGQKRTFYNAVHLCLRVITEVVGDLPLEAYKRLPHAQAVRDHLLEQGTTTTTVRRRLATINAVFNHGIGEAGHAFRSPFAGLKLPREGEDASTRVSFTSAELRVIAAAVKEEGDEVRHIVAMLLDTGARLGEIVGLQAGDLRLDEPVAHIVLRPDRSRDRTLKTDQSARRVPLVGMALWGGERARAHSEGQNWVFPRYAADRNIKSNYASKAVNRWLRRVTGADKTAHSLRHSMRDRLRAAAVPGELQDLIGGWGSLSVGQRYGQGYPLETLRAELIKVVLA